MSAIQKTQTATKAPRVGDWVIEAQRTKAKVCRSYQKDGKQCEEEEKITGRPEDVRRAVGPKYAGETTELEYVHTWTTISREMHDNTTNGVTKRREEKEVQTHNFGDNESIQTTTNPRGYVTEDEATGKPMDKTDYLKMKL
jgi:hypothetical protein